MTRQQSQRGHTGQPIGNGLGVLEASTKEDARRLAEGRWPDTPHTVRPATVQTGQQLRWLRDANTADAARAAGPAPPWALRGRNCPPKEFSLVRLVFVL
jgi:hypothetical protein